ncbi:hypothetical protein ZIOFF_039256 [Zingiber officinale]|uniref:Uncharacterized protein n=1 Tax=Zingiber officinale TaxID=94328 RepID=A0A8J5GB39_ZINOF|nr:hypothetical protein ZIOFF_039256 [Zingiber officinale]
MVRRHGWQLPAHAFQAWFPSLHYAVKLLVFSAVPQFQEEFHTWLLDFSKLKKDRLLLLLLGSSGFDAEWLKLNPVLGSSTVNSEVGYSFSCMESDLLGKIKTKAQLLGYEAHVTSDHPLKLKEHRLDIGDENYDLLGYEVYSRKLVLDNKNKGTTDEQIRSRIGNSDSIDEKFSSKALAWGSHVLHVGDVISVSYTACFRHFTVHAYPLRRRSCGLSCFVKPKRYKKDFCFVASNPEEAVRWVQSFADLQCYINCLPHPIVCVGLARELAFTVEISTYPDGMLA